MKHPILNLIAFFICFTILTSAGCRSERFSSGNTNDTVAKTGDRPAKVNTPSESGTELIKGTVVHISDGDTFIIENGSGERTTVRIHAIDAPELAQAFGRESREALRALIANQTVEIKQQKIDQYHRIVGSVFLDGKDIGLEMLNGGNVWYYRQFQKELTAEDQQAYASAEATALHLDLGLWRDAHPIPPWEYRRGQRK